MIEILRKFLVATLELYQKTLSPDHGWLRAKHPYGFCKFYPSCSQYSKECFEKLALFKALLLSINRVGRCHPWAKPQIDPAPLH